MLIVRPYGIGTRAATGTALGTVTAAATISITPSTSSVRINSAGSQYANSISIAAGYEGQVLNIHNNSGYPTSGAFIIPTGKAISLLYSGAAWRKLSITTTN
jgi:hypothetical protein